MISKYNGTCVYCGGPTKANVDQYELDTKKAYHLSCHEEQWSKPDDAQVALAEKLGFRKS